MRIDGAYVSRASFVFPGLLQEPTRARSRLEVKGTVVSMANVTYYVVLPFVREPDSGELVAEEGREAPNAQCAMTRARATTGRKAGAVAFSRTGDPALGEFEDAIILGRYGQTPTDLTSFTSIA